MKVKEMIIEIQKREEEEKRKERQKEDFTTKEKKDELSPDTRLEIQEQKISENPKDIQKESAREEEKKPDGRRFDLGTSTPTKNSAGEKELKSKEENIGFREKGARKGIKFKDLLKHFEGIGVGKWTAGNVQNENESKKELKDNYRGLGQAGAVSVARDISTDEVIFNDTIEVFVKTDESAIEK